MNEESSVPNPDTAITTDAPEENISLDAFKAALETDPAPAAEPASEAPEPSHRQAKRRDWKTLRAKTTELTRRLRETEAERDALKGNGSPVVPGSTPPAAAPQPAVQAPAVAPAPRAAASVPPVKAAGDDPEPDSTAYDDLTKWMRDHSRWSAREELRAAKAAQDTATQAETQRTEAARLEVQWKAGIAAAKGNTRILKPWPTPRRAFPKAVWSMRGF